MKVLFITNLPSPYNLEYLEELGKKCTVKAIFETGQATDRDSSWAQFETKNFEYAILNGVRTASDKAFSGKICSILKQHKQWVIIFGNPFTATGLLGILYCKMHGMKYVIQSEGGFPGGGNPIKEFMKKRAICGADLCLSGMSEKNDYFLYYGIEKEKVKFYPFASMYKREIQSRLLTPSEKTAIKQALGIPYQHVIISVGRIMGIKGFDVLIKAAAKTVNTEKNFGLYIIGGNPTADLCEVIRDKNLNNIHFIDHVLPPKLAQYYKSADLFVLATRGDTWGLVINEAMSYGLPVITTTRCVAGNELIQDGVNGYLVEPENMDQLSQRMDELLNSREMRETMGERNLERISDYCYEIMAERIYQALNEKYA